MCAVRDGCSRRVLGWAITDHLRADLVDQALTMAFVLRGQLPERVIFHADRGCQYTSAQIADLCGDLGLLQSVGRTGVCWDNAATESFWSTLKTEFYNRHVWVTKADAAFGVGRWIEERFNRLRRHSSIDMMTPVQYENHLHRRLPWPPDRVSVRTGHPQGRERRTGRRSRGTWIRSSRRCGMARHSVGRKSRPGFVGFSRRVTALANCLEGQWCSHWTVGLRPSIEGRLATSRCPTRHTRRSLQPPALQA